jgi:plastocyanin
VIALVASHFSNEKGGFVNTMSCQFLMQPSLGRQGLAFLPNEIWIHAGDSITWTVTADEPHTVTFLTDGQIRPSFTVGCPGFSAGSAIFDGTSCVTSAIL